jgi:phospholipid/cholesterol/gamma-HCH transport system ATP-binding protein
MNDTPKISVRGLHKSFNGKKILSGIDFDLMPGKSLVVIGGSGSGKSVLIKNIIGIMTPEKGSIKVDDEETVEMNWRKRNAIMKKFGMLFQGGALFDSLLVWQNICFYFLQTNLLTKSQAKELAVAKLQMVGLGSDVADLFPAELSGGMQKRVSLARAIANDPEIIFFDEPTTGLDPIMADVINDLIVKCSKTLGATTLTITHDMHSVKKIADDVAMIYEGKFIWKGPRSDLENSGNPYVEQFINGRAEGPITLNLQDHFQ